MLTKVFPIVIKHLSNNLVMYLLVLFCFLAGISAGAYTMGSINDIQREELVGYMDGFFNILEDENINNEMVFKHSVKNNLQLIIMIWILGITVIGIPVIMVLIGIRGFIIGFTVGFLVNEFGTKGLVFVLVSMVPQNLLVIPCIIVCGVMGISYSLYIVNSRKNKLSKKTMINQFVLYSLIMLVILIMFVLGSLIESYIIPIFVKFVSRLL